MQSVPPDQRHIEQVNVELSKAGEDLHMHFPITIATVPFRIPNSKLQPNITHSVCCDHVEGGMYIGPEFQLGQVYDGGGDGFSSEPVLLYRPVYVGIPNPKLSTTPSSKTRKMVFDSSSRTTSRSGTSVSLLSKLDSSSGLGYPGRARSNTTAADADKALTDRNSCNNEDFSAAGGSGLPRTDSSKSTSLVAAKSRENVLEKSIEISDPTEKRLARALSKAALKDSAVEVSDVKLTRGSSKAALKGNIDPDEHKLLRGMSKSAIKDPNEQGKPKLTKGLSKSAIKDKIEPKLMRGLSKSAIKDNVEPIEPKLMRGLSKPAVKDGVEPTEAQLTRGSSKTTQDSHNRNSL